jgi:glycosyltransferase involved in cell wall biosynthesis
MADLSAPLLSIVVPVYNEAESLPEFNRSLLDTLQSLKKSYEVIYCDDGSTDNTPMLIRRWCKNKPYLRLIKLSRNFGKEVAVTAGINEARGQATIILDADGQHPVELIPKFLTRWENGSKVVVGLRTGNQKEGWVKHYGSKLFYKFFNRLTGVKLMPGATDFRLIDSSVREGFVRLTERNRITRGLIDWLGYEPDYIEFRASPRLAGEAGYSFKKLFRLAIDSTISLSISPLYISAYIGAIVLPVSVLLAILMVINVLIGDPFGIHATGSAYLMVLVLFLIGILLVSQGIIGLYLSHIHTESQNRPLYIIDELGSVNRDRR